ncbi:MAG TPA: DUF3795 domain-containing protein [Methanobacterium sp.]|jgi:hypothetical protein|nr:DUF3795 domain-containing protein [Methanobacterium sp.]HOI40750.1 DUF3795 domain-containing protein [Methanobacterium sp.]
MDIAACGLICEECEFFEQQCPGCYEIKGKTFWAEEVMPEKICPIFNCAVNDNVYVNCGKCSKLPCNIFNQLKDPNISDEDYEKSIQDRTLRLKSKQ